MRTTGIFIIIYLLAATQGLKAATYRINSEEGFKNFAGKLTAGDEVIIANGSYSSWALDIPVKGNAQKPVIIRAETPGKVIFSGVVNKPVFKFTGAYVILSGISFSGCQLFKEGQESGLLVEFNNTEGCRLTNCAFTRNTVKTQYMPLVIISGNGRHNKVDSCSFISNIDNQDIQVKITRESCPHYSVISFNLFKDKARVSWKNGNGGECVQIGQDPVLLGTIAAESMVSGNRFIHCNGENEVISNKSSGNSYIKNYFEANDGELVMRGGHDCVIKDNMFEGGTGGIRINGTGHEVTGNKINGIKTAIRLMYGMAKGKTDIGFYIAASGCTIAGNQISNANTGILIGDSKNANWTGKFDTTRYPSPVMQNIAPFDNKISDNNFSNVKDTEVYQ